MTREEILETTTMTEVMRNYGISIRNNMCKCPFHQDSNPSMKVYKTSCYCFTCSKSWDLFAFVQEMDGCSFKEAFLTLGGTYEHGGSLSERFRIEQKRERRKAEMERMRNEQRRQFKEVCRALTMCEVGCKIYEPFSDEWCYYINEREYMRYVFDALYIDESEEYDLNVHRKCQSIITR